MNYLVTLNVTVTINIIGTESIIIKDFDFCDLPIQVLSEECNLYKKLKNKRGNDYKYELYRNGECINELGGYFIINGKEKVIISQERLAYNKLYTHKDPKYILITEVKSQKRNSFIPAKNTYVKLKEVKSKKKLKIENEDIENYDDENDKEENNNEDKIFDDDEETSNGFNNKINNLEIYVSFPGVEDIPLFIIFRALGYESDKVIYDFILHDLLPCNMNNNDILDKFNEMSDIYNNFSNYLEHSRINSYPILNKNASLDYIYSKMDKSLLISNNSVIELKRQKVVNFIIFNFF